VTARFALGALVTVALALIGACGGPDKIDAGGLARKLPAAVLPAHPELVTAVSCPEPIPRELGTVTTCRATLAGTGVDLHVTQVDDNGAVRVQLDDTLLDVDQLSARIAQRLTTDIGIPVSVRCEGPPVVVLHVGDEFRCEARDPDNRTNTYVATILDAAANYDLQLA
jgi:hypothetical protein